MNKVTGIDYWFELVWKAARCGDIITEHEEQWIFCKNGAGVRLVGLTNEEVFLSARYAKYSFSSPSFWQCIYTHSIPGFRTYKYERIASYDGRGAWFKALNDFLSVEKPEEWK